MHQQDKFLYLSTSFFAKNHVQTFVSTEHLPWHLPQSRRTYRQAPIPDGRPQTRLGRLRLHESTKAAKVLPHRLYDVLGYHAIWVHEPCAARLDVRYGLTILSRHAEARLMQRWFEKNDAKF